jgi:hypothetical protein
LTTLTKIFVILVSLFAFIFTPMAISFAARSYDWRALATKYQIEAQNALARERSGQSIAASQVAHLESLRDQERDRVLAAQREIAELEAKREALTKERDELARSRDLLETHSAVLAAEMNVKSRHNDELVGAKEASLRREQELQTTNIWLKDQLQLRSTELEVVKQQLNQKLQEMVACREENDQLRRTAGLGRAGDALTAVPEGIAEPLAAPRRSSIQGSVTEVRGNLVSIDVGSASGIQPGTIMVVTRNNNWIGDLEIASEGLRPNESVGRFRPNEGRQVRSGDRVIDEAAFAAR